jgi:hypothetical protein
MRVLWCTRRLARASALWGNHTHQIIQARMDETTRHTTPPAPSPNDTRCVLCLHSNCFHTHFEHCNQTHTRTHTCQGLGGRFRQDTHTHTRYTRTQCRHRQAIKRTAARLASASTVQCVDANPPPGPRKTACPNPGQVVDCLVSCERTQHTFMCASADRPF